MSQIMENKMNQNLNQTMENKMKKDKMLPYIYRVFKNEDNAVYGGEYIVVEDVNLDTDFLNKHGFKFNWISEEEIFDIQDEIWYGNNDVWNQIQLRIFESAQEAVDYYLQ